MLERYVYRIGEIYIPGLRADVNWAIVGNVNGELSIICGEAGEKQTCPDQGSHRFISGWCEVVALELGTAKFTKGHSQERYIK